MGFFSQHNTSGCYCDIAWTCCGATGYKFRRSSDNCVVSSSESFFFSSPLEYSTYCGFMAPVFWTTRFHACYFTYDLITVESLQEGFIQQVNQLLLNEALSRQLSPCSPCSLSKHFNSLIFFLLRQIYFCLTNLKIHFWGRKLEQFFSADLLPYLHLLHYQSNDLKHSHIHFLSTRFWSVFLCSPLECD